MLSERQVFMVVVMVSAVGLVGCPRSESPPQEYVLAVTTSGPGKVTAIPAVLACPTTCTARVTAGTIITLTAAADEGAAFNGWAGVCSGSKIQCMVTMNQDQAINASWGISGTEKHTVTNPGRVESRDHRNPHVDDPTSGNDEDGDGIGDAYDQCPEDPEDLDGFKDEDGCPDADNDLDRILDVDDRCPNVPEDLDGDEDTDGCPEGAPGSDRDGDGIGDVNDKCPNDPEDRDAFEDADGCPDPDNDRDGILDVDDLCPNNPEDRDAFEDADGCPDPDNDRDGISDMNDQCPNDPESMNGFEDADGCPDRR